MADNPVGALTALLQNTSAYYSGGVTAPPTSPFGLPPMAGTGATTTFQQAQTAEEEVIPEIYLGKGPVLTGPSPDTPRGFGEAGGETKGGKGDKTATLMDVMQAFTKVSAAEQRQMAILLSIAGYTESLTSTGSGASSLETAVKNGFEMTLGETLNAYQNLLKEAATRYTIQGVKVTPEALLREAVAFRLPAGVTWDGDFNALPTALDEAGVEVPGLTHETEDDKGAKKVKPFTGTKTFTSTSTNRDIMDPADAKALTRAMLQRELGRDPTDGEFEDFIGAIQYAQRTNPDKTRTTQSTTYEKGEAISQSSSSTTRQGIGAEGIADIALQKARQNPNWAEWQAVGTYAPALFEALGATVAGR